jgi:hypothetical protein
LLEISIDSYLKNKSSSFNKEIHQYLQVLHSLNIPQKFSIISVVSGQFSSSEHDTILELVKIRNKFVHEGDAFIPDDLEEKIKTSIKALSQLVYGRRFKMPRINPGNMYLSDEQWDS